MVEVNLLLRSLGPVGDQGGIDFTGLLGHQAVHHGYILLAHLALFELKAQGALGIEPPGEQENA